MIIIIAIYTVSYMKYMQEYKIIPDVNALAYQRKRIATNDTKHCILDKQLTELKKREEKVIETLTEAKSSLKSVKDQIDKLKVEHESLVEKREREQSSRQRLIEKRERMSEEVDFAEVNELIRGIEEIVVDINTQIDELEKKIRTQNEKVAEKQAQLLQKEEEKKQLESDMDEIKKKSESFKLLLKEDREKFADEMQKMIIRTLCEVCIIKAGFMHACIHKNLINRTERILKLQEQFQPSLLPIPTSNFSFAMITSNLNKKLVVGLLEMFTKHCYRINKNK